MVEKGKDIRSYDLARSILPAFVFEKGANGKYTDGHFLGTCFLCRVLGVEVFISAAHVLGQEPLKTGELFLIYNKGDDKPIPLKVSAGHIARVGQDFGFLLPTATMQEAYGGNLQALEYARLPLRSGVDVVSYGYPLTEKESVPFQPTELTINPMLFRGYVHTRWDRAALQKFPTVYPLSFPSLPGLSGAPLLTVFEGRMVVVGIMHENRYVGRTLIEEETEEKQDSTIVHKVYFSHPFGVASDFKPFDLIAELLKSHTGKK